jgi:hypothetical protein
MNHYCTLFDVNYLSKGLAMISSLQAKSSGELKVYVLAMDESAEKILNALAIKNVVVIALKDFENEDLKRVKPGRTATEYCWTATPAIVRYVLETYKVPECTYLDADLFFFHDPEILLKEVRSSGKSVLITPHNYSLFFNQTKNSGVYCVQFMYFKNDQAGREVLEDWYTKCIDWCFAKVEGGRFGDQKYLDVWPLKFPKAVHSLKHLGAVAPWNVSQYQIFDDPEGPVGKFSNKKFPVVFYHFHGLHPVAPQTYSFGWYPLNQAVRSALYAPYVTALKSFEDILEKSFSGTFIQRLYPKPEKNLLKQIRRGVLEAYFSLAAKVRP